VTEISFDVSSSKGPRWVVCLGTTEYQVVKGYFNPVTNSFRTILVFLLFVKSGCQTELRKVPDRLYASRKIEHSLRILGRLYFRPVRSGKNVLHCSHARASRAALPAQI
jgi:hypothetical protein